MGIDQTKLKDANRPPEGAPLTQDGWKGTTDPWVVPAPPPLPGWAQNRGKGSTQVDISALKVTAEYIRGLLTPLETIRKRLLGLKVAPGAFYDAHQLIVKVLGGGTGGSGLQPTTLAFVEKAIDAITVAADELQKLSTAYKTTEELNRKTGLDLAEHIERAKTYISNAIGSPSKA
ncbi:hypothetical protein [Allokutzneria albata]|uniref:Uncharacterized protein n=1 Tax=Allokutzneria albata TaxID=211114 RepID=A0A1G9WB30_ALLAB|nr:hypothetical protein [Allokutzneria albata]SDM81493.1 hypothetical protein SAMN04489726_3490 [Allokutzneria albata]